MLPADAPPPLPAVQPAPLELRLSAERTGVDGTARMGMTGLHLLKPLGDAGPLQAWAGVSVFGATQGDRGGFFGWGVSGGARWTHGPWQAEAGLFAGGGGGSPGWVGGGLMLRPHASVGWRVGDLRLSLGVAQLRFPNGRVDSTHPFASIDLAGLGLFGPPGGGAPADAGRRASQALPSELSMTFGQASVPRSVRRDGQGSGPPLRLGGAAFRRDLPGELGPLRPYWVLATAGGLSGAYAGYMEVLGGLGLRLPLQPLTGLPLALRAEAQVGAGGAGAAADTGGGQLHKLQLGASWQLHPQLALVASTGRTGSPGPFRARETRLELAWRTLDVVPGSGARGGVASPATLDWTGWTLAAGLLQHPRVLRDDGTRQPLTLSTLKLERELGPHWRLTGQAGIATHGQAGGYATGQLGLGWLTADRSRAVAGSAGGSVPGGASLLASEADRWRFGAGLSLGAAGGGAVRVGDGWILEGQLIARRAITPNLSLQADVGWLRGAGRQSFSTPQLGLSLVLGFSRLQGTP